MYQILLCDDEEDILYALKIYLKKSEYSFYEAHNGAEAVKIVKEEKIDLVLLDLMMPVMDGYKAMKEIRTFSNVPIILLTAKSEQIDKVAGFEEGADDYITKPFDPIDVQARVAAQIRRYTSFGSKPFENDVLVLGGIELNDRDKTCAINGEEIDLTYSEFEILKLLMKNPGKCFAPTDIYERIWNESIPGCERAVSVHIRHLREKIETDPANPRFLKTVWGQGYCIVGREVS